MTKPPSRYSAAPGASLSTVAIRPPVQDSAVTASKASALCAFKRIYGPHQYACDRSERNPTRLLRHLPSFPYLSDRSLRKLSESAARAATPLFQASPARLGGAGLPAFASWQLRAGSPDRERPPNLKSILGQIAFPALFGNHCYASAARTQACALEALRNLGAKKKHPRRVVDPYEQEYQRGRRSVSGCLCFPPQIPGKCEAAEREQHGGKYAASGSGAPRNKHRRHELKIAAKIRADNKKLAAAMTVSTTPSGRPKVTVKRPARAVMAVDRTSETSSKKAAARTRLKENSLFLRNDHTPSGRGDASRYFIERILK